MDLAVRSSAATIRVGKLEDTRSKQQAVENKHHRDSVIAPMSPINTTDRNKTNRHSRVRNNPTTEAISAPDLYQSPSGRRNRHDGQVLSSKSEHRRQNKSHTTKTRSSSASSVLAAADETVRKAVSRAPTALTMVPSPRRRRNRHVSRLRKTALSPPPPPPLRRMRKARSKSWSGTADSPLVRVQSPIVVETVVSSSSEDDWSETEELADEQIIRTSNTPMPPIGTARTVTGSSSSSLPKRVPRRERRHRLTSSNPLEEGDTSRHHRRSRTPTQLRRRLLIKRRSRSHSPKKSNPLFDKEIVTSDIYGLEEDEPNQSSDCGADNKKHAQCCPKLFLNQDHLTRTERSFHSMPSSIKKSGSIVYAATETLFGRDTKNGQVPSSPFQAKSRRQPIALDHPNKDLPAAEKQPSTRSSSPSTHRHDRGKSKSRDRRSHHLHNHQRHHHHRRRHHHHSHGRKHHHHGSSHTRRRHDRREENHEGRRTRSLSPFVKKEVFSKPLSACEDLFVDENKQGRNGDEDWFLETRDDIHLRDSYRGGGSSSRRSNNDITQRKHARRKEGRRRSVSLSELEDTEYYMFLGDEPDQEQLVDQFFVAEDNGREGRRSSYNSNAVVVSASMMLRKDNIELLANALSDEDDADDGVVACARQADSRHSQLEQARETRQEALSRLKGKTEEIVGESAQRALNQIKLIRQFRRSNSDPSLSWMSFRESNILPAVLEEDESQGGVPPYYKRSSVVQLQSSGGARSRPSVRFSSATFHQQSYNHRPSMRAAASRSSIRIVQPRVDRKSIRLARHGRTKEKRGSILAAIELVASELGETLGITPAQQLHGREVSNNESSTQSDLKGGPPRRSTLIQQRVLDYRDTVTDRVLDYRDTVSDAVDDRLLKGVGRFLQQSTANLASTTAAISSTNSVDSSGAFSGSGTRRRNGDDCENCEKLRPLAVSKDKGSEHFNNSN